MRKRLANISPRALWSFSITSAALVCGLALFFGKTPAPAHTTPVPAIAVSEASPATPTATEPNEVVVPSGNEPLIEKAIVEENVARVIPVPKLRGQEKRFDRRITEKLLAPVIAKTVHPTKRIVRRSRSAVRHRDASTPVLWAAAAIGRPTYSDVVAAFEVLAPQEIARGKKVKVPVHEIVDSGLEEGPLSVSVDLDWKQSSAQIDKVALAEAPARELAQPTPLLTAEEMPVEPRVSFVVSELVQDDLKDLRAQTEQLKDSLPELTIAAREPATSPEVSKPSRRSSGPLEGGSRPAEAPTESASAPVTKVLDAAAELAKMESEPPVAKAAFPIPDIQAPVESVLPQKRVASNETTSARVTTQSAGPAPSRESFSAMTEDQVVDSRAVRARINGLLEVEPALERELGRKTWHIELHLEPIDRSDATQADTEPLDFTYPSEELGEEFSIESFQVERPKRLYARIYESGNAEPASIPYPEVLKPGFKKRIRFSLSLKDYKHYYRYQQNVPSEGKLVTVSVFEGASGDHRNPNKIRGAKVEVVDSPEYGVMVADSEATVRIPNVPTRSEITLKVSAEGFYDNYYTVPIFNRDVYSVAYLVSKDKVDAITNYFTKSPQKDGKSILLTRVFDEKRVPKKGETLSLLFRKGKALYIDSLPDIWLSATTATGLSGFFNIDPSFRAILRGSTVVPLLMNFRPNTASYVELGRAGKRDFHGRLVDPFNRDLPSARIRLVGQSQSVAESDEQGRFVVEGIDLPPGKITFEIEAKDYPITWITVAWDPSRRAQEETLFLLSEGLVNENIKVSGKQTVQKQTGHLFGGAERSLFDGHPGCVRVTLKSASGKAVTPAQGPFGWTADGSLTTNQCLSAQDPRYAFANLPPDEYELKWLDAKGKVFRRHQVLIGADRTSVLTN